uniref:Uncharacterized protein n=1 Tax=Rhizophora mucronata TaxID=61149 RepID=A0A2P2L8Q4_RHIMU
MKGIRVPETPTLWGLGKDQM